jgi:protein phosphatase-4 regulatory subunit 3
LQDEFYNQTMMQDHLFEPILNIVIETMPRDNLLNSACLEFFDFIKQQNIKVLIKHLVDNYRDKMKEITYVNTFSSFISKYDQTNGFTSSAESFQDTEEDTPKRPGTAKGGRWASGIKDLDPTEEEYYNTSDDDDEASSKTTSRNGASPASKPLVDYSSDEENEDGDNDSPPNGNTSESSPVVDTENERALTPTLSTLPSPPERLSEKRRREEDEEDELGKLSHHKRRNSTGGPSPNNVLRRKKSFNNGANGGPGNNGKHNKIAISLSSAIKTSADNKGGDGGS